MIRKIVYTLMTILGALMILIAIIANKLTSGFDKESIDVLTDYAMKLDGLNGISRILDTEVGLLFLMYQINEYSHFIITAGVIWIVIFIYLLENSRRSRSEKKT